jgi:hypothetical protein
MPTVKLTTEQFNICLELAYDRFQEENISNQSSYNYGELPVVPRSYRKIDYKGGKWLIGCKPIK